jgi:tetratricopeptide (TPR) repeat protein
VAATDTNSTPEPVGQRLKRLRLERGFSQRELAGPGVSYAYISRSEAGARRPSVKALRVLAQKLGVSADYLETGREIREIDERELRLTDAELELRLADDPAAPAKRLRTLLAEAVREGDVSAATRARVALGFASWQQGRPADAVELLEAAINSEVLSPSARPEVYATLGRALAASGKPEQAVKVLDQCLKELDEEVVDDPTTHVRCLIYLSHALTDVGEFERAEDVLDDAVRRSEELADPLARVRVYWSLARVSAREGRATAALDNFRRAIALLEATEDTVHLAKAHLGCAWTLISVGKAEDAAGHLDAAERLFGQSADPIDLAYLRTEQAKHAVALEDPDRAVQRAREALEILGDADPAERGDAWRALGAGLALNKDLEGAEDAYRRSSDLLEEHGGPAEYSAALRGWAEVLRRQGRETEALDVLERAAALAVARQPAGVSPS